MTKLLPPTCFLICLCLSLIAHVFVPVAVVLQWPWNLAGLLLLMGGLYLPIAGSQLFAQKQTNINTFLAPGELVTAGLFRYSRNPMYLGFVLALVGVWILAGSVTAASGALVFFLLANYWYIPFEEARCAEVFGDDYASYRQKVRRWL